MAWLAQGGRAIGKSAKERPESGGGEGGGGDVGANKDDDYDGGGLRGPRTFYGVPLCREAMCSGRGMPPTPLPQPGIDCVNRDRPCLPCDIINLRLRSAVTGVQVKQAVAEAQKRYFCNVWNLLFSYLFPGHVTAECPNLKAGDPSSMCRAEKMKKKKAAKSVKSSPPRRLPYGAEPGQAVGPIPDMKIRVKETSKLLRLIKEKPPPPKPVKWMRKMPLKKQPAQPQSQSPPQSQPQSRPTSPELGPLQPRRPFIDDLVLRPGLPPPTRESRQSLPKMPPLPRGGRRGGLRYNIWTMPMLDSSKGGKFI